MAASPRSSVHSTVLAKKLSLLRPVMKRINLGVDVLIDAPLSGPTASGLTIILKRRWIK